MVKSGVWWLTPAIPMMAGLRQKDFWEFKVSLSFIGKDNTSQTT